MEATASKRGEGDKVDPTMADPSLRPLLALADQLARDRQ